MKIKHFLESWKLTSRQETLIDVRALNYSRQVRISLVMRLLSIIVSFATTAVLLQALSLEHYGILSLLISIQAWMGFFDLGIGNGLRTKVAENLAIGNDKEAARLIGVAYWIFTLIFSLLSLITLGIAPSVDWAAVLNSNSIGPTELKVSVASAILLTCFLFVTNLVNSVSAAVQRSSYSAVLSFVSAGVVLITLMVVQALGYVSLLTVIVLQGGATLFLNIAFTIWFFWKWPQVRPRLRFSIRGANALVRLGVGFFLIQMAMIILYSTDRILIAQLVGPESVPQYEVLFKLFSLLITLHVMIAGPLWSAYTEAYQRFDVDWIRAMIRRQLGIVLMLAGLGIVLVPLSNSIIAVWTGGKVSLAYGLPSAMYVFSMITIWNNTFGVFLNGIGRLKAQAYSAIFGALINLPLAYILSSYFSFGVVGIVVASSIATSFQSIALPLMTYRILRRHHGDALVPRKSQ